ncbi:tetratricopeptide repeat protein [Desulfoferula mesophila]|uniref:Sel1 repeat family protein n=1 Tax=Desulfoferula mesophila TaxID=3058419 RepID=A0AAU9EWV8_9BACT|nr:hypothetical protein FAK_30960 [Desulfoferula mesophilus]
MKKIALAILLALCLAQPAWAGSEEGWAAFMKGDYATAIKIFLSLAEQGDAQNQNTMGVMYFFGKGVPQDYKKAIFWYRKAAEQGFVESQASLGEMYENGQGIPQNYKKAAYWYNKAAEQGNVGAQYNLGYLYANGEGVPQNYIKAHMWFNLAAAQGIELAQKGRDMIAAKMTPQQIAEAQRLASEWKPSK